MRRGRLVEQLNHTHGVNVSAKMLSVESLSIRAATNGGNTAITTMFARTERGI